MKQENQKKQLTLEEMEKVNAGIKIVSTKSSTIITPLLRLIGKLFGRDKKEE